MPLLSNPLETGASGTAISTVNSGGPSIDPFDQVTATATCLVNFDATHVGHGNMGMLCQTGGTAGEAYVMWSSRLGGAYTTLYLRAYLYLTANPGTQTRLFRWLSVSTVRGSVQLTTTGKLLISDGAGTGVGTMTNSVPLNQLVRVEAFCTGDPAAGVLEVKLFDSAESTSPLETVTATAQNTGGTIDRVRYGQTGTAVASVTYWLDDLAVLDTGYPGPVGSVPDPSSWVPYLLEPSADQIAQSGRGQFLAPWWDPNPPAMGGTTFPQALSGSLTPAGSLAEQVIKPLAGTTAPAGALPKQDTKPFAGATTPAGGIAKQTNKPLTGTTAPAGALTAVKVVLRAFAGALTPTGALSKLVAKPLAGAATPTGAITKQDQKPLAGMTTPAGALAKQARKSLGGTLTSTGVLATARVILRTFAGAISPAGTLARQAGKGLSGMVMAAGALTRRASKTLGGLLVPAGPLAKQDTKPLAGQTSPSGAINATTSFVPPPRWVEGGATTGTQVEGGADSGATLESGAGGASPEGGAGVGVWFEGGSGHGSSNEGTGSL